MNREQISASEHEEKLGGCWFHAHAMINITDPILREAHRNPGSTVNVSVDRKFPGRKM